MNSEVGAWLAKLDDEGQLVSGFGNAGFAIEDLGQEADPSGEINDIAVQPDGRIVVIGSSFPATDTKSQLIVARFTAGGDLDPSFGDGGVFTLDPTVGDDEGEALSVLPDGKVLVAGFRGNQRHLAPAADPGRPARPELRQRRPDRRQRSPRADIAEGLAVQPDGRPVIAGAAENPGSGLPNSSPAASPGPNRSRSARSRPGNAATAGPRRSSAPAPPTSSRAPGRPT